MKLRRSRSRKHLILLVLCRKVYGAIFERRAISFDSIRENVQACSIIDSKIADAGKLRLQKFFEPVMILSVS